MPKTKTTRCWIEINRVEAFGFDTLWSFRIRTERLIIADSLYQYTSLSEVIVSAANLNQTLQRQLEIVY